MNKKGMTFVFIVLLFLVFGLFSIINGAQYKYQRRSSEETIIGINALAITNAYRTQESTLLFLDNAARVALDKAIMNFGAEGGLNETKCGTSGYNLWNNETDFCFPNKNNFKQEYLDNLKNLTNSYEPVTISNNYYIDINQSDKKLMIKGVTDDVITLSLTIKGEAVEKIDVDSREMTAETINQVNQYNDIFVRAEREFGVETSFLKAIITAESRGNRYAISPTGCAGLAQFCYSTAKDYFDDDKNIISISTSSLCRPKNNLLGQTYTFECPEDVLQSDPRFNPEKAIMTEAEYLSKLSNNKALRGTMNNLAFTAASYNGGLKVVKEAIKITGQENPTWEMVSAQITPELLLENGYRGWSYENRQKKVDEINIYVNRVSSYYEGWGGIDLFAPSIIGTFKFKQNFRTETEYNLSVYDEIIAFANQTILECDDNVEECLKMKIAEHNKNSKHKIMFMTECEEGNDKAYLDFYEGLQDCAYSWGEDCKCQVTKEYNNSELQNMRGYYKIFSEKLSPLTIPIQKDNLFRLNLTEPKSISKDIIINDSFFWIPSIYTFKYDNNKNEKTMVFRDELSGKNFWFENFKNMFIVINDSKHELWAEYEEALIPQTYRYLQMLFSTSNIKFQSLRKPPNPPKKINIGLSCPVAKKIYRLCADTGFEFPTVIENNGASSIIIKDSKIKFGLTLLDTKEPSKIYNLSVKMDSNVDGLVKIRWFDNNTDIALYRIDLFENSNNKTIIKSWDLYTSYSINSSDSKTSQENGILYYENTNNQEIIYSFTEEVPNLKINSNVTYAFVIYSYDDFQNKNKGSKIILA